MYYVYILKSEKNGKYYIGHTKNIVTRIHEHNSGFGISTRSGIPWTLVHTESFPDRSKAMLREAEIKSKKRRSYIDKLISDR